MKIYTKKFETISESNDEQLSWNIDTPVIDARIVFGDIAIKNCNQIHHIRLSVDIFRIPDASFAMIVD